MGKIMKNFECRESSYELLFRELGPCWHLWTSEDHAIIFFNEEMFQAGMTILGFCKTLFPRVDILTFTLMSNHLHIACSGSQEDVLQMFESFKKYLGQYIKAKGYDISLYDFRPQLRRLEDLSDVKNVILYDNRNATVVSSLYTPFNYPWGAGYYFFNTEAKKRYEESSVKILTRQLRKFVRSRKSNYNSELRVLDGYVSPMSFCRIEIAERLFNSPREYFHRISHNIESSKKIASEIGERMYYDDTDLYLAVMGLCRKKYNKSSVAMLNKDEKIELAKVIKFDYNASNKQICRMLRIEPTIIEALFPVKY